MTVLLSQPNHFFDSYLGRNDSVYVNMLFFANLVNQSRHRFHSHYHAL